MSARGTCLARDARSLAMRRGTRMGDVAGGRARRRVVSGVRPGARGAEVVSRAHEGDRARAGRRLHLEAIREPDASAPVTMRQRTRVACEAPRRRQLGQPVRRLRGKKKHTIAHAREAARTRGGRCLSAESGRSAARSRIGETPSRVTSAAWTGSSEPSPRAAADQGSCLRGASCVDVSRCAKNRARAALCAHVVSGSR